MGVGIPYAMAAKLEHPDRPVVAICGDFAFGISAMELETAVRHNVPIVIVVANNDGNGGSLRQRMHMGDSGGERIMMFQPGLRYDQDHGIVRWPCGTRASTRRHRTRAAACDRQQSPRMHQRRRRSRRAFSRRLSAHARTIPMNNATDRATNAPDIDERIAALSPEKRALLARRLADKSGHASQRPLARAIRGKEAVELSFAQQRLWLLDRLLPHAAVYNMPKVLRLVGALDVAALRDAINEVVRRHEALRTTFAVENGAPVQVIVPALRVRAGSGGSAGTGGGRAAGGGAPAGAGGSAGAVRPGAGAAAAGAAAAVGEGRALAAAHDAPHRLRRLVDGGAVAGAVGALRRLQPGRSLATAGVAGAVRGLCRLAARVAAGGECWRSSWATGRKRWRGCRCWSCRPTGRGRRWRATAARRLTFELGRRADGRAAGAGAAGRGDAVHDAAGGVPGAAVPLQRAGGRGGGHAGCRARRGRRLEGLIGFFVNTLVLRGDLAGRRVSGSIWGGCASERWRPMRTRTCRSRSWWRSCDRSGI